MSKRKRDPTFATSEKLTLVDLVEKYFDIVESKKTDSFNMKVKVQQWQRIADEFNSVSSLTHRDWNVLKNCWENMKKRAKQQNTQRHQHFLGTGGGPPKKLNEDPAIERVLELIQARVTGYVNAFDSDGTLILASGSSGPSQEQTQEVQNITQSQEDDSIIPLHTPEVEVEVEIMDEVQTIDWSEYTPGMLRDRRNPALIKSPSPLFIIEELPPSPAAAPAPPPAAPVPPPAAVSGMQVPVAPSRTQTTSRRRPTIKKVQGQDLNAERIKTLITTNTNAQEEHFIQMDILKCQKLREQEMLEQEKLRTEQEKEKTKQEKLRTEQEQIKLLMLKEQFKKIKE